MRTFKVFWIATSIFSLLIPISAKADTMLENHTWHLSIPISTKYDTWRETDTWIDVPRGTSSNHTFINVDSIYKQDNFRFYWVASVDANNSESLSIATIIKVNCTNGENEIMREVFYYPNGRLIIDKDYLNDTIFQNVEGRKKNYYFTDLRKQWANKLICKSRDSL
jgi:hypothetical protein